MHQLCSQQPSMLLCSKIWDGGKGQGTVYPIHQEKKGKKEINGDWQGYTGKVEKHSKNPWAPLREFPDKSVWTCVLLVLAGFQVPLFLQPLTRHEQHNKQQPQLLTCLPVPSFPSLADRPGCAANKTTNTGFSRANGRSLTINQENMIRCQHLFCDEHEEDHENVGRPPAPTTVSLAHGKIQSQRQRTLQGQHRKLGGAFKPQAPRLRDGQLPPAAARLLEQRKELIQKRKQ
eukprot:1159799-Pelagomonas_calceolata.AAC.3